MWFCKGVAQTLDHLDYVLFHCPYTKLVQKSFGRLAYNDFKRDAANEKYEALAALDTVSLEQSYTNKEIEKGFMNFTKNDFLKKVWFFVIKFVTLDWSSLMQSFVYPFCV